LLGVEVTRARVNVGWLSRGRIGRRKRFPVGALSDEAVGALVDVIEAQEVNVTRGFHVCEFCLRVLSAGRCPGSSLAFGIAGGPCSWEAARSVFPLGMGLCSLRPR